MTPTAAPSRPALWAKVIDQTRCIGCHACTTACKSENAVPLSVTRTYVKYVDVGEFPHARRAFQVTRCNQCDDAPCAAACPTGAMFRRPDGIVDFDKSICIGCKACIAACPYDAIFINPEDHSAEKCNFCAHRLDLGLEPACVVVCPTEAIFVGDLNDATSRVAQVVNREPVTVRRPEKGTRPKLFYRGAHQATLDPLAARRPDGGLYMWSEQPAGGGIVPAGHAGRAQAAAAKPEGAGDARATASPWNSSAAALLSYDVPHRRPWDWRVGLYTWTKSIAAGAYLAPLLLILFGAAAWDGALWRVAAPVLGGAALALTGLILILDLEHPTRFHLIFTRPQWRSWLVRGAFIIAAYGGLLVVHFVLGGLGATTALRWLAPYGALLAAATAAYTAYLFAQAKARDLWQNPLAPPHLVVQALLAGGAVLAPVAAAFEPAALQPMLVLLAIACATHALLVLGELTLTHATAHAHAAARELVRGRFAGFFWVGMVLVALGALAPWVGAWAAVPALAGLLAYEHAYVQAGQAVPLA